MTRSSILWTELFADLLMEYTLNVTVGDGKYTVIQGQDGRLRALRYGEEWRDCCGDGLIYTLAAEVEKLREQIKELSSANDSTDPR